MSLLLRLFVVIVVSAVGQGASAQGFCKEKPAPAPPVGFVNFDVTPGTCGPGECHGFSQANCQDIKSCEFNCSGGGHCGCLGDLYCASTGFCGAPQSCDTEDGCGPPPSTGDCHAPGPESCDGKDNDYNGTQDDGCTGTCCAGDTRPAQGACVGIQTCGSTGQWEKCTVPDTGSGHPGPAPDEDTPGNGRDGNGDGAPSADDPHNPCDSGGAPVARGTGQSSSNSSETCEQCAGAPVDLATGLVISDAATDVFHDDELIPLEVTRRWSGQVAYWHQDVRGETRIAPLGAGWLQTYVEVLDVPSFGPHGLSTVVWHTDSGARRRFDPVVGVPGTFKRAQTRNDVLTYDFEMNTYTLARQDGLTQVFEAVGSQTMANNQKRFARPKTLSAGPVTLTYSYFTGTNPNATCPSGGATGPEHHLCAVTTSTGRVLRFAYQSFTFGAGSFEGSTPRQRLVAVLDRNGNTVVSYGFNSATCGGSATSCTEGSLCCVKDAVGVVTRRFQYLGVTTAADFPQLTKVTRGDVTIEEHTYLADGSHQADSVSESLLVTWSRIGSATSALVTDKYRGVSEDSYTVDLTDGQVRSVSGECKCGAEQREWKARTSTVPEGAFFNRMVGTAGDHASSSFAREAKGRPTRVTLNDTLVSTPNGLEPDPTDSLPPVTTDIDARQFDYSYWGDTSLQSSVSEMSLFSGTRSTTTSRVGSGPFVTQVSTTGVTVTDSAGYLSNAGSGTGANTATTTSTYAWSTGSNAALLSKHEVGPATGTSQSGTYREFWPVTGTAMDGRLMRSRQCLTATCVTTPTGGTNGTDFLETNFGASADVTACGFGSAPGYDEFGNVLAWKDQNGVITCSQFDANGRLQSTKIVTETPLTRQYYTSDGRPSLTVFQNTEASRIVYLGDPVLDGGSGETDQFSRGLVRARERWSADPTPTVAFNERLLERTEYDYFLPTVAPFSFRNLVKVERHLSQIATVGMACTTTAQCGEAATCSSGLCIANTCTSDASCSSSGMKLCRRAGSLGTVGGSREQFCMEVTGLTEKSYDDLRRLKEVEVHRLSADLNLAVPEGLQKWQYDDADRVVNSGNEKNRFTTRYTYDGLGRVTAIARATDASGTTFLDSVQYAYDRHGNVKTVTNYATASTQRYSTEYRYDDFGRLIRVESPDSGKRVYRYDEAGRLLEERKENGSTGTSIAYAYDRLGRVTTITRPDTYAPATSYVYDNGDTTWSGLTDCRTTSTITPPTNRFSLGRLAAVYYYTSANLSAWHAVRYAYTYRGDPFREVSLRYGEQPGCVRVATWEYQRTDLPGALTEARLPTGRKLTYTYGALDKEQKSLPLTVSAEVNKWVGGVLQTTTPLLASDATYTRGTLRRLKFANGLIGEFDYALDGSPLKRRALDLLGTGYVYSRREVTAFTEEGYPDTIATRNSKHFERFTYDANLDYLTRARVTNAAGTTTPLGTGHAYSDDTWSYAPTALGNRTSEVVDGTTRTYTYPTGTVSSRVSTATPPVYILVGATSETYAYNYQGALKLVTGSPCSPTCPQITITYDALDRMTAWGGTTFQYDHRNLRTRKISAINGQPTDFWYAGGGDLLGERGCSSPSSCASPRPLQEYIYFAGERIAVLKSSLPDTGGADDTAGAAYSMHNGLLGEPHRLTNSAKEIVWWREHTPWGRISTGSGGQDFEIEDLSTPLQVECYSVTTSNGSATGSGVMAGARTAQVKFDLLKTEGGWDPVQVRGVGSSTALWTRSGNVTSDGLGCCGKNTEPTWNGQTCTTTANCSAPLVCQQPTMNPTSACSGSAGVWSPERSNSASLPINGVDLLFTYDGNSPTSTSTSCAGCLTCQCPDNTSCVAGCCGGGTESYYRYRGVKATQFRANYVRPITINLRLPGQYEDSETGQFNNWNRTYSPTIGRYTSPDPASIVGETRESYSYASSEPEANIDPTGRMSVMWGPIDQPSLADRLISNGLCALFGIACDQAFFQPPPPESAGVPSVPLICKRPRGATVCRCTLRYAPPAETASCPPRVYGDNPNAGLCQAQAKMTAPERCRQYYGHCGYFSD